MEVTCLQNSFIALCKELSKKDGMTYDFKEKLSQDPLEEHFEWHRRVGGTNENPMLGVLQGK